LPLAIFASPFRGAWEERRAILSGKPTNVRNGTSSGIWTCTQLRDGKSVLELLDFDGAPEEVTAWRSLRRAGRQRNPDCVNAPPLLVGKTRRQRGDDPGRGGCGSGDSDGGC